ncbi:hypothetical protein TSO352_02955 [Azospirillum sp. TSO35-2]|nr:hypothetical protein TSO352_02955 [Azospirillum sp. TSO35-2]
MLLARPAGAADGMVTLALPHALRPGETAFVAVTVGPITRGQEVEVTTADGLAIGTITPFGPRRGQGAGTHTLPVPAEAFHDGTLALRLRINRFDGPPRPPTAAEVSAVTLSVTGP